MNSLRITRCLEVCGDGRVVQDGTRVNFITDGWVVVRRVRGVWRGVDMCVCGDGGINVLNSSLDVYIGISFPYFLYQ